MKRCNQTQYCEMMLRGAVLLCRMLEIIAVLKARQASIVQVDITLGIAASVTMIVTTNVALPEDAAMTIFWIASMAW